MLTFSFIGTLTATYNATKGLMAGAGTLTRMLAFTLKDGTAAGQADGIFTADTSLHAGAVDAYNLGAGLRDLYGDQVEFTAIKFLMLEADLTNTADVVIGGGTWLGPFNDPSDSICVRPAPRPSGRRRTPTAGRSSITLTCCNSRATRTPSTR